MKLIHRYEEIISIENLLAAWQEFLRGKRGKRDVQEFRLHLMDNIMLLHDELRQHTYTHGGYRHFRINDPKPRDIHKAGVRDRLLHHAIYRVLYPYFDKRFVADSFSCRNGKGTHKALNRFQTMARAVSQNHRRTCWVLKIDIRKFFANIDHRILLASISHEISDIETMILLQIIVESFTTRSMVGLPLGNLTSQLFVNIYMNTFDQFVKHELKCKHYIRYADDMVLLSDDKTLLIRWLPAIQNVLATRLHLELHPKKISLTTFSSGVDYLGWVHFNDHCVLRTATKKRIMRALKGGASSAAVASYQGMLMDGNTKKIQANLILKQKQKSPSAS